MKLLLVSQDLMIGSRVEGAARQHGLSTVTVGNQATAIEAAGDEACCVVLIDLRLPGLDIAAFVEAVRSHRESALPMVACGPHVHEASLAAAREAGCDAVVTRGQLDRDATHILGSLLV